MTTTRTTTPARRRRGPRGARPARRLRRCTRRRARGRSRSAAGARGRRSRRPRRATTPTSPRPPTRRRPAPAADRGRHPRARRAAGRGLGRHPPDGLAQPAVGADRGLRHRHAARRLGRDLRRPEPAAVPRHHVRAAARGAGEPRGRPGGPHVHHQLRALGDHRVLRRVPHRRAEGAGHAGLRGAGHRGPRTGQRVCAPEGTTTLERLEETYPDVTAVSAPTHTGCLVLFQQGKVDAITGDDTILAGFAAQDPYAKVVGEAFSAEPYGIGVAADQVDLVRFVNGVLDQAKADGTWAASYDRWLGALGTAPGAAGLGVRAGRQPVSGPEAPEAPGRLGEPIPAPELLRYLSGLEAWLANRRTELDRLDQAAQASPASESYTDDVLLALTMWQAIRSRTDELVVVWDSGRADAVDAREDVAAGLGPAGLGAGRRAGVAGRGRDPVRRDDLAGARAAVVRPGHRRPGVAAARSAGGPRPLRGPGRRRHGLPRADRDPAHAGAEARRAGGPRRGHLRTARRARGARGPGRARPHRAGVAAAHAREGPRRRPGHDGRAGDRASRRCTSWPSGAAARSRTRPSSPCRTCPASAPCRTRRTELDAFVDRLAAVGRAFDAVADAYSKPLRERAELRYRLEGARAAADANGRSASPTVRSGYDEARAVVAQTPCDLTLTRFLVEQYEYLSRDLPTVGQEGRHR